MTSPQQRRRHRPGGDRSPFSSPFSNMQNSPIAARRTSPQERRRPAAGFTRRASPVPTDRIDEGDNEEEEDEEDENNNVPQDEDDDDEDNVEEEDDDGAGETSPLLPIFSAAHLDSLPVYNLTHTIRLLILPRCETTLTWDQLRSPQVSQFLVKPIQQQIRASHFSKATLYALIANCLQFSKEIQTNPGNSGVSKTRALVSELLAMKLLKEFSTRDLIDALSYDFDPLQGLAPSSGGFSTPGPNWDQSPRARMAAQPRAARISTLEIAIRAQSKRFLAHPLVVQQLEAIWAGTVVFHSAADDLHRVPVKVTPNQNRGYGTRDTGPSALRASPSQLQPAKQRDHLEPTRFAVRRTATLYDPRDASLFKLSRLRVPRYRQSLSTCSFAVLLGLYLAVLIERPLYITPLEVVFWFWSAGFMLDEIVGFNEQGFSLYILSFWNTFDVGILLILISYYCLRLYGIVMPDAHKHSVADMAYDVLAADAVLLFPRLFSVLDHYRYFSQLLIAFRMMAEDLVAVFILIVISCSGFFVAFTLSFGDRETYDAAGVAYELFQILMGYTPAAWEVWSSYNLLGKIIMTMFLFICQFLIVTMLITVLTNSFMAIVQNANEEHQFVFAVNTISMVKSDALFSYVAPTNIIAWLIAPLRFVLPFRRFVRINRTVIKATHFPILLLIYVYERIFLSGRHFDLSEDIEQRGRTSVEGEGNGFLAPALRVFSPKHGRLREPSVATFRKDKALEEVFRRPFHDNTLRNTERSVDRRKTSNVVNGWMQNMGPGGVASPPAEQDHSIIDRLEARRVAHRRSQMTMRRRQAGHNRDLTEATLSMASDPEDFGTTSLRPPISLRRQESSLPAMSISEKTTPMEADEADNESRRRELVDMTSPNSVTTPQHVQQGMTSEQEDYFQQTPRARPPVASVNKNKAEVSSPKRSPTRNVLTPKASAYGPGHQRARNASTNTILYVPPIQPIEIDSQPTVTVKAASSHNSQRQAGSHSPASPGPKQQKRNADGNVARARPILPPRTVFQSAPDLAGMLFFENQRNRRTSLAMDLGSDIGDNKAVGGGFVGGMPASFATQMAFAAENMQFRKAAEAGNDDQQRMGKLMLARMNTLEEGFREVLKEVRDWKKERGTDTESRSVDGQDLVEMKVGRRRSRLDPPSKKAVWKANYKGKVREAPGRDGGDGDDGDAKREEDAAKGSSV